MNNNYKLGDKVIIPSKYIKDKFYTGTLTLFIQKEGEFLVNMDGPNYSECFKPEEILPYTEENLDKVWKDRIPSYVKKAR